MTPGLLGHLALSSAGVGVGTFVGVLIGLIARRRKGKSDMLFRESVVATAFLAAACAMAVMMTVNYLRMG